MTFWTYPKPACLTVLPVDLKIEEKVVFDETDVAPLIEKEFQGQYDR